MRVSITGLALATLAAMAFGCASDTAAKPGVQTAPQSTNSTPQSANSGDTKTLTLQSAGRDVLRLTVPTDTGSTPKDGWIHLWSRDRSADFSIVAGAHSVDEGVARVPQTIAHEFKDFKTVSTTSLTVGGNPAKRLIGAGLEADDGDPGDADVIVCKIGEHVFIACTHGEGLSAPSQEWILTLVQAAKAP